METTSITQFPRRITDLINAKAAGGAVRLKIAFEILPTDFHHRTNPFQAYIFLAHFKGALDERLFAFRKCYARGCPNNLCTHVSQAVNIANRYLQRDYHTLASAGIEVKQVLFSLDEMIIKFDALKEKEPFPLSLPELIGMAKSGREVAVHIQLELIPAVEHFSNVDNAQTFLSGEFAARIAEKSYSCHRCFACFATDHEKKEKEAAVKVANARLALVYNEFTHNGIMYRPQYFS